MLACSGNDATPITPDDAQSGSRLKLAWYVLADGFQTWANPDDLYDAQLAAHCTPRAWSDGVVRCTPALATFQYYADAACTQPIIAGIPQTRGGYAARGEPGCGNELAELFELTDTRVTVTQAFVLREQACVATAIYDPDGRPLTGVIAAPRPLDTLATLTTAFEGSGDVVIKTRRSDDGLVVPLHPYDAVRDFSCHVGLEHVTSSWCLPVEQLTRYEDRYADPSCLEPVLLVPGCEPPPIVALPTLTCPRLFTLGAPIATDTPLYAQYATCRAESIQPETTAYRIGERIDPLPLTRAAKPSGRREQLIYIDVGDARLRETTHLYDSELATECTLDIHRQLEDGERAVCRPSRQGIIKAYLFSDAQCTQPLPEMLAPGEAVTSCGVTQLADIVDVYAAVHRVGRRYEGAVYEASVPSECTRYMYPLYEIGDQILDSALIAYEKRRDD